MIQQHIHQYQIQRQQYIRIQINKKQQKPIKIMQTTSHKQQQQTNPQKSIHTLLDIYLKFKQQLLTSMMTNDPLSILQSKIFQSFQNDLNNLFLSFQQCAKANCQLSNQAFDFKAKVSEQMGTKIMMYEIDGVEIGVVEKRSSSCDGGAKYQTGKEKMLVNRLRRQQEQAHVDLVIFSNIMNNHFRTNQKSNNIRSSAQSEQNKQNISASSNILKTPDQQLTTSTFLSCSSTMSSLIDSLSTRIWKNPQKQNINKTMRQLLMKIEQENEKIIQQLNRIKKQNDRLLKNMQENSMKQLQYIVQIKYLEKKIMEKQAEIEKLGDQIVRVEQERREQEGEFGRVVRGKNRQIQQLQSMKQRKSYIEQLRQKMALDSIRRTTLCSLNKQKLEIELQKQQLNFHVDLHNSINTSHFRQNQYSNNNYSEETREEQ